MKLTATVIQAGSILLQPEATLDKALSLIRDAAARGATLIVLPEAFLGGYPKGLDFGVHVGSRSPEGRDTFREYFQAAIDAPGAETQAIGDLCRELAIHAVVGAVEREGGTLYCSSLIFTPEAGFAARHRKLMPTAAERLIWGFGDGSTLPVVAAPFGGIGTAICWENYMPLFRAAMYAKGVDFWCAPTVDDREVWASTMRHVALEGRCFVLSANQYLERRDAPAHWKPVQGEAPETVLIAGGSLIVSPLGEVLAGPLRGGEGMLTAELDTDDLARARFDFDPVGHYARPDVFSLRVDEAPKRAVEAV
jgi:nitrilase